MRHNKLKSINEEQGIGLVEVIAALGLSIIILTALISLSLFTVRSSLQSKLMLEGTKLANRELELVRALRDNSTAWENGSNGFLNQIAPCVAGNPCHMDSASLTAVAGSRIISPGAPEETEIFFIAYDPVDSSDLQLTDEEVRIAVTVRWTIAGEYKYARLYTDLTNWANK